MNKEKSLQRFWELNKDKFPFIVRFVCIIGLIILAPLYFLPLSGKPSLPIVILTQFTGAICITIFLLPTIFLSGYFPYRRHIRICERGAVSSFLTNYGFEKEYLHANNKWRLTDVIHKGKVENYDTVLRTEKGSRLTLSILVASKWRNYTIKNLNHIEEETIRILDSIDERKNANH